MIYYAVAGAWAVVFALATGMVRQNYAAIAKKLSFDGFLATDRAR